MTFETIRTLRLLAPLTLAVAWLTPGLASAQSPCASVAIAARTSAQAAAQADLYREIGNAQNFEDAGERFDAIGDAFDALTEALDEAAEVYGARLAVCARLGGGRYRPEIDPSDFVANIDNPFLPYRPGATRSFEKVLPNGSVERIELTVLQDTRVIQGVTCTTVRDVVRIGSEIIEDTFDYYAQDTRGNVWYFGEIARNYEDGYLTDLDGSWIAGVDGAEAGVVMPAQPAIGQVYRQEFLLGEAEDTAVPVALGATVTVPAGTFSGGLTTFDFTPLEADLRERKTYAPGIGVVQEVDETTGEVLELVAYTL